MNRLAANYLRPVSVVLAVALGAGIVCGCGPSRPPTALVSGEVTLEGEPLSSAAVTFTPVAGGRPAYGATDAEGHFRLSTFSADDGAILGEHIATISKEEPGSGVIIEEGNLDGGPVDPSATPTSLVPSRYSRVDTSPLRYTVTDAMAPIEIALSAE